MLQVYYIELCWSLISRTCLQVGSSRKRYVCTMQYTWMNVCMYVYVCMRDFMHVCGCTVWMCATCTCVLVFRVHVCTLNVNTENVMTWHVQNIVERLDRCGDQEQLNQFLLKKKGPIHVSKIDPVVLLIGLQHWSTTIAPLLHEWVVVLIRQS